MTLANVGKALEKMNLISKESAESIRKAEEIIEGICGMITYVGAVKSLLDTFGFFPKEDILGKKLDDILGKFDEVLDLIEIGEHIADELDQARSIDTLIGPVHSSMTLLQAYLIDENNPNLDRTKIFNTPMDASETLALDGFWKGIFAEVLAYDMENYDLMDLRHYWIDKTSPPDASGKISVVFDYKEALPAFLYAISARIAVLFALEPGFRSNEAYRAELIEYSEKLIEVHNKIVQNGIIPLNGPDAFALFSSYAREDGLFPSFYKTSWRKNSCKYGVVDLYSNLEKASNYPLPFFLALENPPLPGLLSSNYSNYIFQYYDGTIMILIPIGNLEERDLMYWFNISSLPEIFWGASEPVRYYYEIIFLPKIIIRTIKLWQDLYSELGLPEVWRTINHLRWLVGYDPLELPDIPCTTNSIQNSNFIEIFKFFNLHQCIRRSLRNLYSIFHIVKIRGAFILAYKNPDLNVINSIINNPSVNFSMMEIASELNVLPPISLNRLYED